MYNNTQKYVITFATDEQGNPIKYRFMLSLSKRLQEMEKTALEATMGTDGIDSVQPHGRYTLEVTICRAFDPDAVLAEMKEKLDRAMSAIIMPAGPKLLV